MAEFSLTSAAFAVGGTIPRRHSCDGEDRSPPLSWAAPPTGSRSLALILEDPDAPGGRFVHWLAWAIPPDTGGLAEELGLAPGAGVAELERALTASLLSVAELVGTYER